MLLNLPKYKLAEAAGNSYTYSVVVASGKVSSNLTRFPLFIDLSDMPASFWDLARTDGGNIRAYLSDGTTLIPHDVTSIDTVRQLGGMFVQYDLLSGSNNTIIIKLLDPDTTTKLSVTDTNGRNAVWVDYEVVWVFPETANRTGNTFTQTMGIVFQSEWIRDGYSDMVGNPHQGLAVDASGNLVTIDTNYLRRHTTSNYVTVLASNADPVGAIKTATGNSVLNHLSDGCIIAGELWVTANKYPVSGGHNEFLCVFNLSTLALDRTYNVSSVGRHVAGICYDPVGGVIYGCDFNDGTTLMKFNTSGSYTGTLSLSTTVSTPQGVEIVDGKIIISSNGTYDLYEYEMDGTYIGAILKNPQSGASEGISYANGVLYHMDVDGDLTTYQKLAQFKDWARIHYNNLEVTLPRSTTWSMGTSFYWQDPTSQIQQGILSLANGTTSGNRATLACKTATDKIALWNSTDSWVDTTTTPVFKSNLRLAAKHNGTTERKIFVNGTLGATDATISARPAGAGTDMDFIVNASDNAAGEDGEAYYQYAWLATTYLSDAWLAADGANMSSPSTFYNTITEL